MRIGFFSDVHGNLEALESAFEDFESESIDKLVFLGDVVGYGPDPDKCVELVDTKAAIKLLGNHDAAVVGLLDTTYFNEFAQASIEFTSGILSPDSIKRIKRFKMEATCDRFHLVHSTPRDPESWGYLLDMEDAEESFDFFKEQVCVIAHSHKPMIILKRGDNFCEFVEPDSVTLEDDCRYIVNAGSIGQPRDGDPRSSYVIYDSKDESVKIKRVAYDFRNTQTKMARANLPQFLIERIALGR